MINLPGKKYQPENGNFIAGFFCCVLIQKQNPRLGIGLAFFRIMNVLLFYRHSQGEDTHSKKPQYVGRGLYFLVKNKADAATACYHGEVLLHAQEKESVLLHSFWNGEQVLPSFFTELSKKIAGKVMLGAVNLSQRCTHNFRNILGIQ